MTTTDTDYAGLAKAAAGNWQKFQCFAWWGKPPDPERWAIFYTRNRDSGLLDVSNHVAITKALDRFDQAENPTVIWQDHSHWGPGWVTALVIRVFDRRGRVTKAFKCWCDIQARLEDYPVLSEEDYSEREYDAALEGIRQQGRRHVIEDAPDDWPGQVYDWLSDNDDRQLENHDDQGAYPSDESIREALTELGLLDTDD
jgi:hypothetical protein